MKLFCALIIILCCGRSTFAAPADTPASDPFLLSLNKATDAEAKPEARSNTNGTTTSITVTIPNNDAPPPPSPSELDKEQKNRIREEFFQEQTYRDQLMRDKVRREERERQQDYERKRQQEEQNAKVAGKPTVPTAVAAVPVMPVNNMQQRTMVPAPNGGYQQLPPQYGVPVQPARPPQQNINPTELLSSGALNKLLHPQFPMGADAGSSLIPALIGPGMKQSMTQQQNQQNAALLDPRLLQTAFPQNNGFNGLGNTMGTMNGLPLQQQSMIPNFGQATPGFGQQQGYLPQNTMMQPTMPMQTGFGNGYGNGMMNPALSTNTLYPQQVMQG